MMKPEEAPVGTVVVIGHPANGVTATKWADGFYRYNGGVRGGDAVLYDDLYKAARPIYVPEEAPTTSSMSIWERMEEYGRLEKEVWCNAHYTGEWNGKPRKFWCRRNKNHAGRHSCPADEAEARDGET